MQSTFDFGLNEQGQIEIPISTPTSGYLNISLISNQAYLLQVYGSDPLHENGIDSFAVSNILQNSLPDVGSALVLTGTSADIANLGVKGIGTATWHLYLWIEIPFSAKTGVYTFLLTVTMIGA